MSLILAFGQECVDIDFSGGRYRSYISILGIGSASFKPLPVFDSLLVRDFRERVRDDDSGLDVQGDDLYELSLVSKRNGKLVLCLTDDRKAILGYYRRVSRASKLDVDDRTRERIIPQQ
jgi:hypothetical protein